MRESMKAAVYSRYGPPDVVQIEDIAKPVPADNEVLIRVYATTVCAADWRMRKADPFFIRFMMGLWRPQKVHVLGMEFAGEVQGIGKSVTRFAAGDQVFGGTGFRFGAHAEYVCLAENANLAIKPQNMSLKEAAAVCFGEFTALHFLKRANLQHWTENPDTWRVWKRWCVRRSTGEVLRRACNGGLQHFEFGASQVSRR